MTLPVDQLWVQWKMAGYVFENCRHFMDLLLYLKVVYFEEEIKQKATGSGNGCGLKRK